MEKKGEEDGERGREGCVKRRTASGGYMAFNVLVSYFLW